MLGLVVIFLILAAQYERWSLPLVVLVSVPFGMFGAIGLWLRGLPNDVYFQIALVTLIGLSAKNASSSLNSPCRTYGKSGVPLAEAALEATRQRFRPIVMTSMAFVLGCLPLAVSSGAGAISRHSIGTGVVGGMLASTFIAPYFVPLFFVLVMRYGEARRAEAGSGCPCA